MAWRGWAASILCAALAAPPAGAEDATRRAALMAEAEAVLATAPEVDRDAERMGAIGPSEAGRQIAIRLAEAGHFEDAARIAAQISDPRDQARAVRDVVSAHLQTESLSPDRRLREVSDLVARISRDPAIVAELATRIAAWLTDQGDKAGSVELLARAEKAAVLIGEASQQGQALAAIAL